MAAQSLGDAAVAASCAPDSSINFNWVHHLKCLEMFVLLKRDCFLSSSSQAPAAHTGEPFMT
jgi:hypothetical protein